MEHVDAQEAAEKWNTLMSKRDDKKYALMCEQVGLNTGIWFSLTTIQIDGIPVLSWWPVNWPWPVRIDLRGIIMRCPWLYDLSWREFTHGFGTNLTYSDEVFSPLGAYCFSVSFIVAREVTKWLAGLTKKAWVHNINNAEWLVFCFSTSKHWICRNFLRCVKTAVERCFDEFVISMNLWLASAASITSLGRRDDSDWLES